MDQHKPLDDFDAFEPERGATRRCWIVLPVVLLVVLLMSGGAGYVLGRGIWTIPDSTKQHLPRFVIEWLPSPSAASKRLPAELKDYAFELVDTTARHGEAILSVRLVHKPTRTPVSDAVIFARHLDMAPQGMPTMTAAVEPAPASEPGTYRFKANLTMQGKWQLSLAAKVQGESGTVQNKLVLEATP